MVAWDESLACRKRIACEVCRDHAGGRAFRLALGRTFALPAGEVDFECPHGQPWNWKTPADWTPDQPSRGLGDTVAKLTHAVGVSPCGGCKERQKRLNELVPYKAKGR